MQRYYFMVQFLPKEANQALLTGRCVSIMHGFICRNSILGLGTAFPDWSDDSIGDAVAFIHNDSATLSNLRQQSYFQDMQDSGFFKLSKVDVVPPECVEVKFKRNQGIAKIFPAEGRRRLKRLKKRAIARGEVFYPKKMEEPRELDIFHRIAMSSSSTEEDYILHIQREVVDKLSEPEFSRYGFASNAKFNGTVPDLSSLIDTI